MAFDYDITAGLTHPPGILESTPDNRNPFYSHHWEVVFQRMPNVRYFCQKVTIPNLSVPPVEIPTRMNPIHFEGTSYASQSLSIEFMLDEDFATYLELFNWFKQCFPYDDSITYDANRRTQFDASVILYTNKHNPNVRFNFHNCFPISLGAINLDESTADNIPYFIPADFTFDYFTVEKLA